MSGNTYSNPANRNITYAGEFLAYAMPVEVLGRVGVSSKKPIPKNNTDTITFRRWLPKGASTANPNTWNVDPAAHRLTEGETPNADQMAVQDIQAQLSEYGVLYRFTNRAVDMHEDGARLPMAMKRMVGERMGLVLEKIRWGQLKAGTNVYRAGNVASRALINTQISGNMLRNIARGLMTNRASHVTRILSGSPNQETSPIEASFIVACHTNLASDIRSQLADFVPLAKYGTRNAIHEKELGSWEEFRFVVSPELDPYLAVGATATANTRLSNGIPNSAGTELCDVYPFVVMTEECYGDVILRGKDAISATVIMPGEKDKTDPLGQRGVCGASTYFTAVRLNEQHMAIGECAVSSL